MRVANTDRIVFGTFCAFLWCLPSTSAWVASFKPTFGKVAMEIGSVGFGSALASSILLGSMPGFALAVDFTGSFSGKKTRLLRSFIRMIMLTTDGPTACCPQFHQA